MGLWWRVRSNPSAGGHDASDADPATVCVVTPAKIGAAAAPLAFPAAHVPRQGLLALAPPNILLMPPIALKGARPDDLDLLLGAQDPEVKTEALDGFDAVARTVSWGVACQWWATTPHIRVRMSNSASLLCGKVVCSCESLWVLMSARLSSMWHC